MAYPEAAAAHPNLEAHLEELPCRAPEEHSRHKHRIHRLAGRQEGAEELVAAMGQLRAELHSHRGRRIRNRLLRDPEPMGVHFHGLAVRNRRDGCLGLSAAKERHRWEAGLVAKASYRGRRSPDRDPLRCDEARGHLRPAHLPTALA